MMKELLLGQKGALLITIIAMLSLLSIMGAAVISMVTSSSMTSVNLSYSKQAFNVAGGGLERGSGYLLRDWPRGDCAEMDVNLSNVSFSPGILTVSQDSGSPYYSSSPATLSAAITSTDLVIPVSTVAGYADSGRILVDREWIDYVKKEEAVTAACSSPPCFIANLRGADGSTAISHTSGTKAGQYQCTFSSTGGVPDLTSPASGKRVVSQAIMLQEAWIVGKNMYNMNGLHCVSQNDCWAAGQNGTIIQWDGAGWGTATSPTGKELKGITCTSSTNCWAVGNLNVNDFTIIQWNGTSWSDQSLTDAINKKNLNSIHCADANNCWAVGQRNGDNFTFVRWNGTSWSASPLTDAINRADLNGVYCDSSTDCWAVGQGGSIVQWNGTSWSAATSPTAKHLKGITCTSSTNCWAVGQRNGNDFTIIQWNGISWSDQSLTDATNKMDLNSIHCADANNCWAVGQRQGNNFTFVQWNGTTWSASPLTDVTNRANLNSVYCTSSTDCWTVGMAGTFLRWDGSSWSLLGGAGETMLHWDSVSWSDKSHILLPAGIGELTSVSMLSYADGWAVGRRSGGNATVIRWNGTAWNAVPPSPAVDKDLESVFAVSADDAWAVGQTGTIIRWNGTNWSTATSPTAKNLRDITCTSSTNCWAVGQQNGDDFTIIQWNGTSWSDQSVTDPPNKKDLNSIHCADANNCWAVGQRQGNNFTFVRWNGIFWTASPLTDVTNRANLNSVYCTSSTNCWAVGQRIGNNFTFLRWNGTTWTANPLTDATNSAQLNDVFLATSNDGWAVGMTSTLLHWDGAAWAIYSSPVTGNLNSLHIVGPKVRPQTMWRETFN